MYSSILKITITLLLGFFFVSCSSFHYQYEIPLNINDGIETESIKSSGLDSSNFIELLKKIEKKEYLNIHSVLVSKNNKLVLEEYFNNHNINTKHELRSAAKSLTSAMMGIAIDKKLIKNADQKLFSIVNFYPMINNWDKRKEDIRIKHLLTMTAGIDCGKVFDPNSNCGSKKYLSKDPLKHILDLPIVNNPGEIFSYNDGLPMLALSAIAISAKMQIKEFQEKYLFNPLGILKDSVSTAISSRGMMKFGLLYLNKGIWKGERIISEEWINESTKIHIKNPNNYMDGYGYYWWHKTFTVNNKKYESYFAAGNGGQYIFIIPSEKLVVVLTGGNYVDFNNNQSFEVRTQPYRILNNDILPALINH